jgi:hypothetical protein
MQIQPAFNAGPSTGAQGVSFPTQSGGTSPGAGEQVRADWNVRMNVSHDSGFVGGAGRLLIHNQVVEERREITFFLPAAMSDRPGRLSLESAVVCSAKPGIPATAGQQLAIRTESARSIVTIPMLGLNDWIYIDITWTGSFPSGGTVFQGGQIPLGDFHPQLAIDIQQDDGRIAVGPVPARYEVELGSDLGAVVRLDGDTPGGVVSRASDDGKMTMHDFKSYGSSRIDALLMPPGAAFAATPEPIIEHAPQGPVPSLEGDQPRFTR